ncbi:MAG: DapH/DapD/GlmU-related protein [Candidatus Sericytochromatia bacterium]
MPFLLYDGVLWLLFSLSHGLALGGALLLGQWLWMHLPLVLLGVLLPSLGLVYLLGLFLVVRLLRLFLPPLESGYHAVPGSTGFYVWTLHFTLNRLIWLHPLKNLILYSATLRWLAFRALGGKVGFSTSISADVDFVDLPLIEIGSDSLIGSGSLLSGHFMSTEKLHLGPIQIGKNVNMGGNCQVGPHVKIGDGTWIGADCSLAPLVTIGQNCRIEPLSVLPPGTELADGETWPQYEGLQ